MADVDFSDLIPRPKGEMGKVMADVGSPYALPRPVITNAPADYRTPPTPDYMKPGYKAPEKNDLDFSDLIPKEQPKKPPVSGDQDQNLRSAMDEIHKRLSASPSATVRGIAEALTSGLGSMASSAVGGFAGIGTTLAGGKAETGVQAVEKVAEKIPFKAETPEGKAMEEVFSLVPQWNHKAGDFIFEKTGSPLAATSVETGLTAAEMLLPGLKKGAKDAVEKGKVTQDDLGEHPRTGPPRVEEAQPQADRGDRPSAGPEVGKEAQAGVELPKGVPNRFATPEEASAIYQMAGIDPVAAKNMASKPIAMGALRERLGRLMGSPEAADRVLRNAASEGRFRTPEDLVAQSKDVPPKDVAPQTQELLQQPEPRAAPATGKQLSDELYRLPQMGRAEMINALKLMKQIPAEDMKILRSEKMYHSFEDPNIKLTPEESALRKRYLEPIADDSQRIYKKLADKGEEVDDIGYVPRKVVGKGSLLDRMATGAGFHPESGRALGRRADSTKERTMFALESPDGERMVVAKASDGSLQAFKGGKPEKVYSDAADLKVGNTVKIGDKDWKLTQARTGEIETATNLKYYKDAFANMVDNLLQLKRMEREMDFLNKWKESPDFKRIATTKTGNRVPEGWKTTDMPIFRGYHFEPRVAEILDDFYNKPGGSAYEMFAKANKVVTSSMFYNPLPHIFNVADHWAVQRGFRWLYPPAYRDLVPTTIEAIKSVVTKDEKYLRMINEGAGLMYPTTLTEGFYTKLLDNVARDPNITPMAKMLGYANPAKMVAGIYKAARHGLWAPSDMMMMQSYLEKMRNGADINKAIADTEKHIPNYRIPNRIGMDNTYGRMLSQVMRNPVLSIFGRYHYGVLRSYGEMVKEMVGKEVPLKDRADALGKMAMLGVTGLVVYPALSAVVQSVVNNTNAAFRRYGSATVPYAIFEMLNGEKNPEQVLQAIVTPAPITKAMVELFTNTNLFNRKQIYDPQDSMLQIAADVGQHLGSSSYPFQQGARVLTGKQEPGQVIEQQVGIVDPTEEQVAAKERYQERVKREHASKKRKREQDQEEESTTEEEE